MDEREGKMLAEASADELLEELQSRAETLVVGVVFHAEPGTYRVEYSGSELTALGLAAEVQTSIRRELARRPNVTED